MLQKNKKHASEKILTKQFWRFYTGLAILLVVFGCIAVAISNFFQYAKKPESFPIRTVIVDGHLIHTSQQEIESVVLPILPTGFFTLPVDTIKQKLLQLPWLQSVSVHRRWPDQLTIQLIEQQALACWEGQSLFNTRGELFTPLAYQCSDKLVKLVGAEDQSAIVWMAYEKISALFEKYSMPAITQLLEDDSKNWQLSLPGVTVFLGPQVNFDRNLQRLVNIYPQLVKENPTLTRIDMRYPMGVTVS